MSNVNSLLEINNLIVKKDIFMREHYDFEDKSGTILGQAECDVFLHPAKIIVTDASGSMIMYIEEKTPSLRNQFTFYDTTGEELGTIQKKFAKFFGEEFWVENNGVEFMRIYVNSNENDYQMKIKGFQVVSVHKKRVSMRKDRLDVSIVGGVDRRVVIGAMLVIEHLNATEGTIWHGE